jgi:hypothetical protein
MASNFEELAYLVAHLLISSSPQAETAREDGSHQDLDSSMFDTGHCPQYLPQSNKQILRTPHRRQEVECSGSGGHHALFTQCGKNNKPVELGGAASSAIISSLQITLHSK